MEDNVQLNNPQELAACISRQKDLLSQYAELISQESKELAFLENLLSETSQSLNSRKRGIYIALEQAKSQDDSESMRQAMRGLQTMLVKCEEQSQMLAYCNDLLVGIRQDSANLLKESAAIADTGRVVSSKIQQLILKITETL